MSAEDGQHPIWGLVVRTKEIVRSLNQNLNSLASLMGHFSPEIPPEPFHRVEPRAMGGPVEQDPTTGRGFIIQVCAGMVPGHLNCSMWMFLHQRRHFQAAFAIFLCHPCAPSGSWFILQTLDPFCPVTLQPAQDWDATFANKFGHVFGRNLVRLRAAPSGLSFERAADLFFGKVLPALQAALLSMAALGCGSCRHFTFPYLCACT